MPESRFAVVWERLVLVVLIAVCFVYTFVASFSISLHAIGYGESIGSQVLMAITYLMDLILVADFIMRFNMASETTTGKKFKGAVSRDLVLFHKKKCFCINRNRQKWSIIVINYNPSGSQFFIFKMG